MKLNYKRTLLVGLAFLSICTFWQAYDGIIPLILKNTFGIGESATGQIMAIDNMLALVMLPLFGSLSDKTHTPIGKRTPYIIFGTIVAVVSMLLLFEKPLWAFRKQHKLTRPGQSFGHLHSA